MKYSMLRMIVPVLTLCILLPGHLALSQEDFQFEVGQTAYVVAMKTNGSPDFSTEQKIRKEFKNKKKFDLAPSLSSADFVFLMFAEYEYNQVVVSGVGIGSEDMKSASALVVLPETYSEYKASLYMMRDEALWQYTKNNNMWRTGGLPGNIVKAFHKDVFKK